MTFSPTSNQDYTNQNLLFHCRGKHMKKNYHPNPIYHHFKHNFPPGFHRLNVYVYSVLLCRSTLFGKTRGTFMGRRLSKTIVFIL